MPNTDYDAPFVSGSPQAPRQPNWVRFETIHGETVIVNAAFVVAVIQNAGESCTLCLGPTTLSVKGTVDRITTDIDVLTDQNARGD